MLQQILDIYRGAPYDFRRHACADDPLRDRFDEWLDYYRLKWSIAKALQPTRILEIGVRYGYAARAFLDAAPTARYVGLDADLPTFGGQPGALAWTRRALQDFAVELIETNTQRLDRLPGGDYDLIHIDGQQDGDGTFHDLNLALAQGRYLLVDGYFWTRENFLAANEWLWLNQAALDWTVAIPGYAGELLIKTRLDAAPASQPVLPEEREASPDSRRLAACYTGQYYLNDCGGYAQWRRSRGQTLDDPRLRAVADIARALNPEPARVLDLGAGRGELTYHFAAAGAEVTAIDYSQDAAALIEQTFAGAEELRRRVRLVCASVTDPAVYAGRYALAVASDLIEHLGPAELDALYALASQHLEPRGALVVHTAPNLWNYRYEHPRQQRQAQRAGCWLPRIRRSYYERLMHINEQSPRVLKNQLARHFPHVHLWFAGPSDLGGSLLRRCGIGELRRATSLFAVAAHHPLDVPALRAVLGMEPLTPDAAARISLDVVAAPDAMAAGGRHAVRVALRNASDRPLSSHGPNPFYLSYHWEHETGEVAVHDGLRSPLPAPCWPGEVQECAATVQAPPGAGRYRLHLAPVQEGVRWHDSACADRIVVEVTASG
jgi:SAM-dependent methyltransferase